MQGSQDFCHGCNGCSNKMLLAVPQEQFREWLRGLDKGLYGVHVSGGASNELNPISFAGRGVLLQYYPAC